MRTALITFLLVIALVLGFAFFVPHTHESIPPPTGESAGAPPQVVLHDVYHKGTHTITGSLEAPTPCITVSAEATVVAGSASTSPDTIDIAVSMPPDVGICLEQITSMTFSVSALAGADALLTASVNGVEASTTEQ